MQVIHPPRPKGEKFEYVYYLTDESFDYPTGYGYDTYRNTMQHGFSIYIEYFSSFTACFNNIHHCACQCAREEHHLLEGV